MNHNYIHLQNIRFTYPKTDSFELQLSSFELTKNTHLLLKGLSGSGKTTLLNIITGLLHPDSGSVSIASTDITCLSTTQRDRFRADHFGIIFQQFNLINYLNIIENIVLPCHFSHQRKERALTTSASLEHEARTLCKALDLESSLHDKPVYQLSIGQQQRVAIARACIGSPPIIIADEPTAALDPTRKDQFMSLLMEQCAAHKTTLLFVSHDTQLESYFNHSFSLDKPSHVFA